MAELFLINLTPVVYGFDQMLRHARKQDGRIAVNDYVAASADQYILYSS